MFVSHRWDKPNPSKRIKTARKLTNVSDLGNVYAASDEEASSGNEEGDSDEVAPEK